MATITKINDFRQYILRKLGSPVIANIEISSDQIDDCIDDAVQLFYEDHYDGVEVGYIFVDITAGTKEYTLDTKVQAVLEVLKNDSALVDDEPLLISELYQGSMYVSPYVDLVSVEIWRQNVKNYQNAYTKDVLFDFNSTTHKLFLHVSPEVTETWALRVYKSNDDLNELYNNRWLKKYATELSRLQWGNNLSKYSGATLPGGAQFNYTDIISQAQDAIEKLEEELYEKYSEPIDFFIG